MSSRETIVAVMAEIIERRLRRPAKDDDWERLGLDSMGIIEFIVEVEDRTGSQFNGKDFDFEKVAWREMAWHFE